MFNEEAIFGSQFVFLHRESVYSGHAWGRGCAWWGVHHVFSSDYKAPEWAFHLTSLPDTTQTSWENIQIQWGASYFQINRKHAKSWSTLWGFQRHWALIELLRLMLVGALPVISMGTELGESWMSTKIPKGLRRSHWLSLEFVLVFRGFQTESALPCEWGLSMLAFSNHICWEWMDVWHPVLHCLRPGLLCVPEFRYLSYSSPLCTLMPQICLWLQSI